jgi:hypothetical protein
MKHVSRKEILDYVTYEDQRSEIREKIMEIKELRRVNVGGVLLFPLFFHGFRFVDLRKLHNPESLSG